MTLAARSPDTQLAVPTATPRSPPARDPRARLAASRGNAVTPRPSGWRAAAWCLAGAALLMASNAVSAHSASDAYLTLTTAAAGAGKVTLQGQWDIALRDLDFALKLDDGNGRLTWGEVRHHQAAIEHYAFQYLKLGGPGNACSIKPGRQMIDDHADGAYAALFFEAVCAHVPRKLTLHYTLFFAIDPSHRGIFVMHSDSNVATALLSPDNAKVDLSF